jgi:hypothetical protein
MSHECCPASRTPYLAPLGRPLNEINQQHPARRSPHRLRHAVDKLAARQSRPSAVWDVVLALRLCLEPLLISPHSASAAVDRKESAVKLFRYRKPSLNTLFGITAAKRRVKRELGISQVQAWTKPSRVKQRVKQQVGLYSPVARVIRQTAKGNFPSFLGLFGKKR